MQKIQNQINLSSSIETIKLLQLNDEKSIEKVKLVQKYLEEIKINL
jgi:hypothetical protein